MKLLSLNVGQPRSVEWNGKIVLTSIFKAPVDGQRQVSFLNVEGDAQADLRVHGGADKAVYAYDQSFYAQWQQELSDWSDWTPGLFGENLTTEGLQDEHVKIGDVFQIGTVILQAIQPRFPCYKLNVRFALPDMIQRFYAQGRHGIYFKVLEEGTLQAGDSIQLLEPSVYSITIQDVTNAFVTRGADRAKLEQIVDLPYLPESLRPVFKKLLAQYESFD